MPSRAIAEARPWGVALTSLTRTVWGAEAGAKEGVFVTEIHFSYDLQ